MPRNPVRIMPRHGSYLGEISYTRTVNIPWAQNNIQLIAAITVSVFVENNMLHAHAATNTFNPLPSNFVTSSLPNFTHHKTSAAGPLLQNNGREVVARYTSEVSYTSMYSFFYEPNLITFVTLNI